MPIKILLIAFALFAIVKVVIRLRHEELKKLEAFFWIAFWIIVGVAALDPGATTYVAKFVGVGRGVDLVFYLSVAVLFYLIFRIFVRLERIERNITKVTREDALKTGNVVSKK